jgi:hypothetical protein
MMEVDIHGAADAGVVEVWGKLTPEGVVEQRWLAPVNEVELATEEQVAKDAAAPPAGGPPRSS